MRNVARNGADTEAMLLGNKIYKGIMGAIKARAQELQRQHDEKCKELDAEHAEKVEALRAELVSTKENHATSLIQSVVGKIL